VTGQPLQPVARPAPAWRAVAGLAGFAVVAALVIGVAHDLTRGRIAQNESQALLRVLHTVVPAGSHDNDLAADRVLLPVDGDDRELRPVYRARLDGAPVAAVVTTVAAGYAGPIRLLVAIAPDGTVLAARAVDHGETPGIGDFIDARRSDWMQTFGGRRLDRPAPERWRLRSETGEFDGVAGATITARAVVTGVRHALEYANTHPQEIWQP
jgi:electron transport complex protein RnfG